MVKNVRILNLGDLVTPNAINGIKYFITQLSSKNTNINAELIQKAVMAVVMQEQSSEGIITRFKLGILFDHNDYEKQITEFDALMIQKFKDKIKELTSNPDIELSVTQEDWNTAWSKMNPSYAEIEPFLNDAVEFNEQRDEEKELCNEIRLISYTNPKDIKQLIRELNANKVAHKVNEEGALIEIRGIKIETTYASKKTKAELIEDIIKQCKKQSGVTLQSDNKPKDVKYIRGINKIDDPVLRMELDKSNMSVEEAAKKHFIETMIWNRTAQPSLIAMLNDSTVQQILLPVANL